MKKNEVSIALKELLKKAGVSHPSDLIGKVITIRLSYKEKFTDLMFQEISRVVIRHNPSGLPYGIFLKLSGSECFSLQYSQEYNQENKFWQYCERNLNSSELEKKWSVELSFPKKDDKSL